MYGLTFWNRMACSVITFCQTLYSGIFVSHLFAFFLNNSGTNNKTIL